MISIIRAIRSISSDEYPNIALAAITANRGAPIKHNEIRITIN
jgi:hypothetical protein